VLEGLDLLHEVFDGLAFSDVTWVVWSTASVRLCSILVASLRPPLLALAWSRGEMTLGLWLVLHVMRMEALERPLLCELRICCILL
jgi:hypothetical protein